MLSTFGILKKQPPLKGEPNDEELAFLERCKPDLEALEELRKVKLKIYEFRKKLAIPAVILLTPFLGYIDWWLLLLQRGNDDRGAGLSIAFLGALYWWVTKPKREYAREYKIKILPGLVKIFGNFTYNADGCVNMEALEASKILPAHDRCVSEDYFCGEYEETGIEFSEVNLKKKVRTKNGHRYVSVFRGLIIVVDMRHKKFLGHTILNHNRSKIGQWFQEKTVKLERANMVDPEFEKMFDAYTNDQVEARWLIDPVMIERLKALYVEYEGEKLLSAFFDNKMLILISSKHNHFEPADLYTLATNPQSIISMKREIAQTLSIIDKLNLYDSKKIRAAG